MNRIHTKTLQTVRKFVASIAERPSLRERARVSVFQAQYSVLLQSNPCPRAVFHGNPKNPRYKQI